MKRNKRFDALSLLTAVLLTNTILIVMFAHALSNQMLMVIPTALNIVVLGVLANEAGL